MKLTVYGDFNNLLSYLASARVDVILEAGLAAVEWRAVEHDRRVHTTGRRIDTGLAAMVHGDMAEVRSRLRRDEQLPMRVPSFVSNTAAATAAYAIAPPEAADEVRHRLFRAVWTEGRNISDPTVVERLTGMAVDALPERGVRWRHFWLGLDRPTVPMLILHTGYVTRGSVAVACLGRLASTGSLPHRPWHEFLADILNDRFEPQRETAIGRPEEVTNARRTLARQVPHPAGTIPPERGNGPGEAVKSI